MRVGLNRLSPWIAIVALVLLGGQGTGLRPACAAAPDARSRVAILNDTLLGVDPVIAEAVAEALRRAGFATEFLPADAVCDSAVLAVDKYFLFVIPNAKCYPAAGAKALTGYLAGRGNLMVVGSSPFDNPAWKQGGRWLDKAALHALIAKQQPDRVLFAFDEPGKPVGWTRGGKSQKSGSAAVIPGGPQGSAACLRIDFDYESGVSDAWSAAVKRDPNSRGGGLLCFWAKGDGRTPQLAVRLTEGNRMDQRGIAVVALDSKWKYYVLSADDFRRLGQADPFTARRVGFEFVGPLTPLVTNGKHTVWIDQVGVARNPLAALGSLERSDLPLIETLAPGYKTYPLRDIGELKLVTAQAIITDRPALPRPTAAYSCYARPEGKGFERGYKWRWIPLVRACDAQGVERGTAVWMLLHGAALAEGPAFEDAVQRLAGGTPPKPAPCFEGAVCAVCAITDPAALQRIAQTSLLGDMAGRIRDGLFLDHAGAQEFSYWPGEKARLGAVVVNRGRQRAAVEVRVRVRPEDAPEAVFQQTAGVTIEPGQSGRVAFEWTVEKQANRRYRVTTELLRQGKPIDVIEHGVGILSTDKPRPDEFVSVRDGDFWLDGKQWYPMGVNYWPRYAIALECEDYTYHWLTPGFYNPEEVERDLKQLESLGANFVCIRAHHRHDRRTLLDFLRRARDHGIRTMVFVQSHEISDDPHYFQGIMMPFHFQAEASAEFIRASRLADNPALVGYDLIWEPAGWVFGGTMRAFGWKDPAPYRQRWDKAWAGWIAQRYGSLENAEADWGRPAPRRGQQVTSPSDEQLRADGPWRVMVAAYRRFMDDLMSRYWNDATRKLRELDPNHLVSYRQGNLPPIDFTLTATPKHVDFFCQEGYDFRPGAEGEAAAGFVNRYIHFTTRGKPYLWVEFGANAWDLGSMQPSEAAIAFQGQSHELIYRLALQTGARGATPWWLAGGYRVSERSDYGILNPDGTLRPSGQALQKYARLFKTPRTYPAANTWFTMDRDAHSGSHWYVAHHEGAAAFRQAAAAGRNLGIRTSGTGTTSADTPMVAVGNTKYSGHNPPKYLDAEFNWFKIKVGQGPWIEVAHGARIRVPRGAPIVAAASVGNLQEATWLAPASCPGKPGAVCLASTDASDLKFKQAIRKDTAYLEDADFGPSFPLSEGIAAETKVELQMTAEGRAWFGEKLRFTLEPAVGHEGEVSVRKDCTTISDFAEPGALQPWKLDRAGPKSKVELVPGPEGTRAAQVTFVCEAQPGTTPPNMALMRTFDGKATAGAGFTRLTFWHKGDRVTVVFVEQDRGDYYTFSTGAANEWHRVAICFDYFGPGYNGGGKGKGSFDLARMEKLRLMFPPTPGKSNTFAVAQLALERSADDVDPRLFAGSQAPARLDLYPQKLNLPVNRTRPLVVVVGNEHRCGLKGVKVELSLEGPGGLSPHGDRQGSHAAKLLQVTTDTEGKARARFHPTKSVGQRAVISARLVDAGVALTARAEFATVAEFHKVHLGPDGFFVKPDGERIIPLGGFWMSWSRKIEGGEARQRITRPILCASPAEQHTWYAYLAANGVNCLRGYWLPSPPCNAIFALGAAGNQDMSRLDASGKINEPVVAALERTLAIGGEHGIGSTLTIAPCAGFFIGGGGGNGAWRRLPEGKSRAQVMHDAEDFLRAIVPRLMFNPHVWAYELMNEQNDNTFAWSERFIGVIKELDEVTPVMVSIAVGLQSADPLAWMKNTSIDVYQPHVYTQAERPDVDSGLTMEVHNNATGGPKPWLLGESGLFGFEQEEKGSYVNRDCLWFAMLNRACGAFLWGDDHRSVTQCKVAAEIIRLVDWKSLGDAPGAVAVPIPRDTSGMTVFRTTEGKRTLGVMTDYARWALEHGVSLDFPAGIRPEGLSCSARAFAPPAIAPPFDIGQGYQLKCRMSRDGKLVVGYLRNVSGIALEKAYYIRRRQPAAVDVKWRLPADRYTLSVWDLDTGRRTNVAAGKTGQWKHDPTEHDFVLLWRNATVDGG